MTIDIEPAFQNKPNIFKYATKELSQDAFFCWLIAWADERNAGVDAALHAIGKRFVDMLLAEHGLATGPRGRVKVHRQYNYVDILVELGDDLILLIEDKIHAGIHGDQLARYKERIETEFAGRAIAPIFLKTGDQAKYDRVDQAGFKRVGRDKLLGFLRSACSESDHPILHDYFAVIEEMEKAVQSFLSVPPSEWSGSWPWIGLYTRLQAEFDDLIWDYVSNATGGFLGAWWNSKSWTHPATGRVHFVYLQIEQGPVCFKIEVEKSDDKATPRDAWRSALVESAEKAGLAIQRPRRMGHGTWMTVARLEPEEWLKLDGKGLLDFSATVSCLREAMKTMDEAVIAVQAQHQNPTI